VSPRHAAATHSLLDDSVSPKMLALLSSCLHVHEGGPQQRHFRVAASPQHPRATIAGGTARTTGNKDRHHLASHICS
jgi:hypothetical protein